MFTVTTSPHSSASTSPNHSPQGAGTGKLGSRSAKPIITDPREAFALVQRKLPNHVRVNHVKKIVICHEAVQDRVNLIVTGWNYKHPDQQYTTAPVRSDLWQRKVIQAGV